MPIYEYACQKCGRHHEIMQKITDQPLTECTECGGRLKKMISNTSFVLKGTGWYATDYAGGKSASACPKTEKTSETKSESKPEGKSETKTEKKSSAEAAVSK